MPRRDVIFLKFIAVVSAHADGPKFSITLGPSACKCNYTPC